MDIATGFAVVFLSAIGAALGTLLREYFASRGRKSGEIDAVASNLAEVLRQLRETTGVAEETRAAISSGVWIDQEKWKLKRDAYLTLLENQHRFEQAIVESKLGGGTDDEQGIRHDELLKKRREADPDELAAVLRAHMVAELIMPPESFAVLEEFTRTLAQSAIRSGLRVDGQNFQELYLASRRASVLLVEAARRDLALVKDGA